jgi:hypothetical protein
MTDAEIDALWIAHRASGDMRAFGRAVADAAERAALAEPAAPSAAPVAWRTFDGEGGYDYRTYEDNEDYAAEWAKRNPRHVGWVGLLYTAPPAAPSVPASQWIACSEQLPDANIEVLAFADEAMYLAVYEPDGWWSPGCGYMRHRVTHWMDLPAAPSDEEKER